MVPSVTDPAEADAPPNGVASSVTTSPLAAPVRVPEIVAVAYLPPEYTT